MTTTDPTQAAKAATIGASMAADRLFREYGVRGEIQIVAHGTYVVTLREGSAVHIVAGTARECLDKLDGE
jgi:hypothetical protein